MSAGRLRWYARRLQAMSPQELAWRLHDQVLHQAWRRLQVGVGTPPERPPGTFAEPAFRAGLPAGARTQVPATVAGAIVSAAEGILAGNWEILGVPRSDIAEPDWFADPVTGRTAPQGEYAFAIDHRSEEVTGNVKQLWDLSRHHHLTLLAAGWYLSGRQELAETVSDQLRSWWAANPFLSGIHWTSGIEVAERLLAWVWIRRLLDDWEQAPDLFESNPAAVQQIYWHQRYLDAFRSRGSSANNHVIAEAAGQLVAACAFDWFQSSSQWRRRALRLFEDELAHNTFPSGLNREQASEYHGFVAELTCLAVAEAAHAGVELRPTTWGLLAAILDAGAAILDASGNLGRQGDGDDGRGLVVDPPSTGRWTALLGAGARLVGAPPWWPPVSETAFGALVGGLPGGLAGPPTRVPARSASRTSHFADAGLTLLRSPGSGSGSESQPEIWCRCDGGPHGFLAIAAHAHADALSVEVRYGGIDILADPGTYCYHGEEQWRSYFRSTRGHNTIEVDGEDQSISGGPFLWTTKANTTLVDVRFGNGGEVTSWCARHDGYERLSVPLTHERRVSLEVAERRLVIADRLVSDGPHAVRLSFHLGPRVQAELTGPQAELSWHDDPSGAARLALPAELRWSLHRGDTDPVLGWYSAGFGSRQPSATLVGEGGSRPGVTELTTTLQFSP